MEADLTPISPSALGLVNVCSDREGPVIVRRVLLLLCAEDAVELLLLEIVALLVLAAVKNLLAATA